jgi:hypothetical protein
MYVPSPRSSQLYHPLAVQLKLFLHRCRTHTTSTNSKKRSSSTSHFETFSHSDTLRRMEEDRERVSRIRLPCMARIKKLGLTSPSFLPIA